MNTSKIKIALIAILCCCWAVNTKAQLANATFYSATYRITSHENAITGSCWESGTESYSGYLCSNDNLNGGEGCYFATCDNNGDCTYNNGGNYLIGGRTSTATTLNNRIDAWEDDTAPRETYNGSADDCHRTESQSIYFRLANPVTWTATPTYGSTADHEWQVQYYWYYSPGGSTLTPNCSVQNTGYSAGNLASWSVNLTGGVAYRFTNCSLSSEDTHIRLFSTNGYTVLYDQDDQCGLQSQLDFIAPSTGTYFIEISHHSRGLLTAGGTLQYYALPSNAGSMNVSQYDFCASDGNFASAGVVTANNYTGTPNWQWGGSNGSWNGWCTGSMGLSSSTPSSSSSSNACGTCCFPKKTSTSDGNADRIRVIVQNDGCSSATSSTVLIRNHYNEAPSSVSFSPANPCVGQSTTITANFPTAINILGTVEFSTSCGGTPFATVAAGNNVTSVSTTIAAPAGNTTYYARYNPGSGTNCGATSCASATLVPDPTAPTVTCPANQSLNTTSTTCASAPYFYNVTASDNCSVTSGPNQTGGLGSGSVFPKGTTTNTFTASDAKGNTGSCSFTVTVTDATAPSISCPANITTNVSPSTSCSATVNYTAPTGTDNCTGATTSQIAGQASGTSFAVGNTTNTFRVTDAVGLTAQCSFIVRVVDNVAPTISCPANQTLSTATNSCAATTTYSNPTGADNCGTVNISQTGGLASGSSFPKGTTTNTFLATDGSGNTAGCSFSIVVNDNQAPSITCPANISVNVAAGTCAQTVTYTAPSGTDNCPGQTTAQIAGQASGTSYAKGTTTNTFKVTDAVGATAQCSFNVVVTDNIAPQISCPANITTNVAPNTCAATVTYSTPVGTDNCPGASTSQTAGQASGTSFPKGTTTNTFVVSDANSPALTASCSFNVVVIDNQAPTISCPSNITVNTATNTCAATVSYVAPVGTDNCPGATTSQIAGQASGTSFPKGTTTNTFRVSDANTPALTAQCSFVVVVNDAQAPAITCPNNISVFTDPNLCTAVVTYAAPVGTDNCPGATTTQIGGQASGTAFPKGTTTNTFRVSDANSPALTAQCSFSVTVSDNQDPAITCPANITVSNTPGQCSGTATYTAPTGTDNCPGQTTAQTDGLASGATYPKGNTTNTFTVTDASGNETSCSFIVRVEDTENPTITCPANITVSNTTGQCSGVATWDMPTVAGGGGTTISYLTYSEDFVVGQMPTTQATNWCSYRSGLVASNNYTGLTIKGSNDPVGLSVTDASVANQIAAALRTGIPGSWVSDGHTWAVDISECGGDPSPCGTPGVALFIDDEAAGVCGCTGGPGYYIRPEVGYDFAWGGVNSDVCGAQNDQTLTVVFEVTSTGGGGGGSGAADNCPGASVAQTGGLASGSAYPVGNTTNTLTVTDASGNTASCTFIVRVNDTENPTIACPANITVSNDPGQCSAVVTYSVGSSDNCPGQTVAQTGGLASGATFPKGNTSNSFTATDAAGNTASCTFIVRVNDTENPTITCPSNITVSNDAGQCSAVVTYSVGSTDNCPGQTVAQTGGQASGSAFPKGTTTNSFTVTDASSNTASCSFTVTVNDTEDPTITCPSNITVSNDPGQCSAVVTYSVGSTDNCPGQTVAQTGGQASGSAFPKGTTSNSFTVTDASGNTASCSFTVTVNDTENPTITCPANITVNSAPGTCAATVTYTAPVGSDNCPGQTTAQTGGQASGTSYAVGTTTNTFTVTDASGNTASCSFDVVVEDHEAPVITYCPADRFRPTAPGLCYANVTIEPLTATDNCGPVTITNSFTGTANASGQYPKGITQVDWTVTDSHGNTSTCQTFILVIDGEAPVARCKDATVTLNSSGFASINPSDVDNGSTDNCVIISRNLSNNIFTCSNVGNNSVTLTVIDNSGNTAACTANVLVKDVLPPTALCQNATVYLDANGNATVSASQIDNGSSDACGIASRTLDNSSFTCANLGSANPVTLTVTDNNGNSSSCSATVTVIDNTPPTAVCSDYTVQLDATGHGSATAADYSSASTDNCTITNRQVNVTNFDCSDVGSNPVTVILTDQSGNNSFCFVNAIVEDNVPPDAVCANVTLQLNASGQASTTAAAIGSASTDACGISSMTLSQYDFNCSNVGNNTVTLTVIDVNSNASSCNATVTVQDVTPPTAICQNVTVQLDAAGNGSTTAAAVDNGSSDICGIGSLSLDNSSFTCANVGSGNTVTLTVTDVNGNSSTCSATVTVQDNVAPVASCKSATVTLNSSGSGSITTADVDNGSSDACGIANLALNNSSFGCANVGSGNTVTLTVTDVNGNSSTCNSTITVLDLTAPIAVCQDVTVQLNNTGDGSTSAAAVNNGSSDACGIASLSLSKTTFNCSNVGNNNVTLTVTDVNGNSSTCGAVVTVQDNVAPVATCTNVTVNLDATGNGSTSAAAVNNGSSDACGIASLTLNNTSFTCANVGSGNTVTLTVTDVNGNSSTCTATVTVRDLVAPVAQCQNITIQLNASGSATITGAQVDNGSSDACGIASLTVSPNNFTCANVSTTQSTTPTTSNLFISEYIEGSGNNKAIELFNGTGATINFATTPYSIQIFANGATSATSTISLSSGSVANGDVYVIRNSSSSVPNIAAQADLATASLNYNGNDAVVLLKGATQVDIFGRIGQDPDPGNGAATGWSAGGNQTQDRTLVRKGTVTSGNTANASGFPSLGTEWNQFATDNAANLGSHTLTPTTSTIPAQNPVTLTVTDVNGNSSTCSANVTVQDVTPPTAVCQNVTVTLDNSGNGSTTPAAVNNGSSDACGLANLSLNNSNFTCANVGSGNTVTLTVTDVNGNSSTCTATVTVRDVTPPTALCKTATVTLDASGNGSTTAAAVDNGSSDACGIASRTLNNSSFTCANVGSNTVTLTVTDVNGNSSTCNGSVIVRDLTPPTAICQAVTLTLNSAGSATLTPAQVNNGSTDACGVANLSLSKTNYNCSNVGTSNVTLTVTDVNGNSSTCTGAITVRDLTPPTAICQNVTVTLNAAGTGTTTATAVDNGSSDACGIASRTLNNSSFTCANVGSGNTVTLTVTDVNGNSSTCTATVTVRDLTAPVAVCQNVTTQLDASGNGSITAAQVDNNSTDACGIASLSVSPNTFNCSNVTPSVPNATDLFISEYVEGSSNNKYIEIYNGTGASVNLSNYQLRFYANGAASPTNTDVLSGTLANNSTIVYKNSSATIYGGAATAQPSVQFNGNDAMALFKISTSSFVDIFGRIGDNPGTAWTSGGNTTVDKTLRRKSSVNSGVTTNPSGTGPGAFTTLGTEWDQFNIDDVSGLGSHARGANNTVTLTVTDVNGNSSTCTANVTVQDNVAPVAVCQPVTVTLNSAGAGSITPAQVNNGSTDACGIANLSLDNSNFSCANVGSGNTVTLTVTDVNGNSSTCNATITVRDLTAPVAVCQAVTVNLDAAGTGSITPAQVNNGSSDACGIAGQSLDNSNFNCSNVGNNTVTLTVTDVNSNSSTCNATITVRDLVAPVAVCQDVTVQLDATGNGNTTAAAVNNGSSDACGVASLSLSQTSFNCSEVGNNPETLTVTDVNGNSSTCSTVVTVEDHIDPVAICQDVTVQLNADGDGTTIASAVDNGSTDACGIASLSLDQTSFNCGNVGGNTVTLTVTDVNGNSSTCQANVTVEDHIAPEAMCQNVDVYLDVDGYGSTTPMAVNNGSTDACGIAPQCPPHAPNVSCLSGLALSKQNFTCADVGPNTVTLYVTDNNGNQSSCTATVTVHDDIPPVAVCQNVTVQLDNTGNGSTTAAAVDNGSTDACGIATLALNQTGFVCDEVGENTVTLTVTDVNGNSSTCDATVTVQDNVAPVAVCQDVTVQLDNTGNGSTTAAAVNNGSSDACGIASLLLSQTAFSCSEVGPNPETLTVTDVNGNSSTCSATVVVQDNVAPVAVCQDVTVQLDDTGNGSTTAAAVNNGSSDACGVASLSLSQTAFNCSEVGDNPETLTVTDVNGNSSTCSTTVTVQDNVAPVAVCQNVTVQLDATGSGSTTAAAVDNGSSDACGIASLSLSQTAFNCSEVGNNPETLTVTDVNGNSSTCSTTVTVQDNVAPVAVCQNVTVQLDASGNGSTTAAAVNNGSSDACGIASLSLSQTAFVCSEVGNNPETLTVTDVNGNSSTCSTTIIVQDNVAPVAICQDVTVQLDNTGNGSTTAAAVNNGSSDACGIASLSLSQTAFVCSEVGNNPETLTVTDVNGNSSTCSTTVTVEDNVAPVAVCQDVTVQLNSAGSGSTTAAAVDNGSSDACGIASLSLSQTTFNCSEVGDNPETLTVTDVNGNSSTCATTIVVQDNVAPVAVCQDVTVQLDNTGNGSTTAAAVNNGSSDACGIASLSLSQTAFVCSEVGNNPETLTVTDVNGNSSTCSTTIVVEDNVAPVAVCQDVTVQLDASGNGNTTASAVDNGSSDACGIASLSLSQTAFNCSHVGNNTVTLTATDVNNNSSTCTAVVTVEDHIAPVAVCQDVTVQLDASGNGSTTAAAVNNGSSDACGIASLSLSQTSFNCSEVGPNPETLTVTDVNGNSSTCSTTVTVQDNVAPVAVCQNVTVQLDASGNGSTTAAAVNNGSSDACGIASLSLSQTAFVCSEVGNNPETLTVTDVNGNSSTCSTTIIVQDNVAPVALCKSITITLNAAGTATITASQVDNGSNDACGIQSLSVAPNSFNCSNVGDNTVTLTATDNNNNSSTCTANVRVVDATPPVAQCKNVTVTLSGGTVTVTGAQVNNNSTDACGIQSLTVAPNTFTCANIGNNNVTLTVTDVNGNSSTCGAVVNVVGSIPTVYISQSQLPIFCQGQQIILTANANMPVTYLWSTTETTQSINVYASGTYSVTVTNTYGCTASSNTNVVYSPTTQLSSYTLLATKHVKLQEHSVVNSGGVGIQYIKGSGKVELKKYSTVTAPGTFVKSPTITVDATSAATTKIYSSAGVTLPPFYANTMTGGSNVTVAKNSTVTLTGTNYGDIKVNEGATVTFTQSNVYIKKLEVKKDGSQIKFTGCTNLIIKEGVKLDEFTQFNPTQQPVTIYSGKEVEIDKGSTVYANIYADKHIKTKKGKDASEAINMYGQYIADHIHSEGYVNWNYGTACGTCTPPTAPVAAPTADDQDDDGDCNDDGNLVSDNTQTTTSSQNVATPPTKNTTSTSGLKISSYPNPFSDYADITFTSEVDDNVRLAVLSPTGNEVDMLYQGPVNANQEYKFRFNSNNTQSSGIYFYRIQTSDGKAVVGKMILAK